MLGYVVSSCIAVLLVVCTTVFIYMKRTFLYWKKRNIPHFEPSFPFGNFENPITNKTNPAIYLARFYNQFKRMGWKYGGIYAFSSPIFVPIDPELIKYILIKDFNNFSARGFYNCEKLQPLAASISTIDGERWRVLRAKFAPPFTSAKTRTMFDLMVKSTKAMEDFLAEQISDKNGVNVRDCVSRLTLDIIGNCAFGIECNSFQNSKIYKLLNRLVASATDFTKFFFCTTLPNLARFLRFRMYAEGELREMAALLDDTVRFRTESNTIRNDFLDILVHMKGKGEVSMDEIKGQTLIFLIGGYETSATVITFCLFELARNQDIQEKLRAEIRSKLAENGNVLSYEVAQDMKYLDMVINETLRMYPPLAILNRVCGDDVKIPNTDHVIERGTMVFMSVYGLHYDPEYFPNPDKFDPTRFSNQNKSKILPCTFLPFGDGPRNCIGMSFGKQEMKVGLITMLKDYKFTLNPRTKYPFDYECCLILTPKESIYLNIERVNT